MLTKLVDKNNRVLLQVFTHILQWYLQMKIITAF